MNILPSLCIPKIPNGLDKYKIIEILNTTVAIVDRIDIINKLNTRGEKYSIGFVHFKNPYNDNNSSQTEIIACNKILNGESLKIMYDFPYYIKLNIKHKA